MRREVGCRQTLPHWNIASHYSTFTDSDNPSSWRICLSSFAKLVAESVATVTENSNSILRSDPERSLGRIFVPSRFQTSGGTAPETRSSLLEVTVSGTRLGVDPGSGTGTVTGPGSGSEA